MVATLPPPPVTRPQWGPLAASLVALGAGGVLLAAYGWRHAALFGVGGLLGMVLYVTSFGFTSAYRRALLHGELEAVYAQLIMLALATILFAPILARGTALGHNVVPALAPVGLQVAIGAFMFGLGMQLGGGCGSGTLFSVGGGNARTLVTLVAFIAGAFWASLHMPAWGRLPSVPPISLGEELGWPTAVALQLAVLLAVGLYLRTLRHGRVPRSTDRSERAPARLGSVLSVFNHPAARLLLAGGVALAVLNLVTLVLAGHPWTITWGFTLWGRKAAEWIGWESSTSAFWSGGFASRALAQPVLRDVTSVMDLGIVIGALATSASLGRFGPRVRMSGRSLIGAIVGGLLLGYGSRIAFGCNIGAFFSGVASTSVHGWLWIAAALPGTWLGVRLRPGFGLENEAPPAC